MQRMIFVFFASVIVCNHALSKEATSSSEQPGPIGGSPTVYSRPRGGDGGNDSRGGNQIIQCYNCVLGGPAGGSGGAGGNAIGSGVKPPDSSSSIISKCSLRIASNAVIDAQKCYYEKSGRSFSIIAGSDNRKYVYKISITLNDDKTGSGTLSGGKASIIRSLGTMTRERACWVSLDKAVEVCAWK